MIDEGERGVVGEEEEDAVAVHEISRQRTADGTSPGRPSLQGATQY